MRKQAQSQRQLAASGTPPSPPPQVLLRGLSVLEALNRRLVSTVEHIAAATGLPKPTVVRILDQLVTAEFVQRMPKRRGYMLDERVQTLSVGYHSSDIVVRECRSPLSQFTAKHKWPISLATLDVDTMRIRASTVQESPFSTPGDHSRIARRVPILAAALGRAYLAFCPDDEREIILALLRASVREDDRPARDAEYVRRLFATIRRTGYAVSAPKLNDPAIGLAVPVMLGGQVIACLSVRYLGKAITEAEVARRYLAALRETASTIAATVHAPRSRGSQQEAR